MRVWFWPFWQASLVWQAWIECLGRLCRVCSVLAYPCFSLVHSYPWMEFQSYAVLWGMVLCYWSYWFQTAKTLWKQYCVLYTEPASIGWKKDLFESGPLDAAFSFLSFGARPLIRWLAFFEACKLCYCFALCFLYYMNSLARRYSSHLHYAWLDALDCSSSWGWSCACCRLHFGEGQAFYFWMDCCGPERMMF